MDPVSAGIAVGSQFLDIFSRQQQQDQQNRLNFMNSVEQNKLAMDMWRLNNEYNAPKNQRKRMEEAGFNPNLLYGHGVLTTSPSGPTQVAPQYHAPDLSGYQQLAVNEINREYIEAQKDTAIAQARLVNAQADIASHDAKAVDKQSETLSTDPWYARILDRAKRYIYQTFRAPVENSERPESPRLKGAYKNESSGASGGW